jgi:hypothetical protein
MEVRGNTATSLAGGVFLDVATADLTGSVVEQNQAASGGGLYLRDSDVTGGTVTGNTADTGAGVYITGTGTGTSSLVGTPIQGNEASDSGGGIAAFGSFAATGVTVSSNVSSVRAGGVYCTQSATCELGAMGVTGNVATQYGGGVYATNGATMTTQGATVTDNLSERGGGIYINGGASVVVDGGSVLRNGDATTVSGGGARLQDGNLQSIQVDWGSAADDNLPDDVYVSSLGLLYDAYGATASFSCDEVSGCM